MPAVLFEGGTFRPVFSCGVMDALLDEDIMFPYCIGVSAGSADAASYISRQRGRNIEVLEKYRNDKRYMGKRNLLKERSMFGVQFAFRDIPNIHVPFDMETFRKYDGQFIAVTTDAQTGHVQYFTQKDIDKDFEVFHGTCALPGIIPPAVIRGREYFDGGLADPIPIDKVLSDGNEKVLVVLTRPKGYIKACRRSDILIARSIEKKYPAIARALVNRPKVLLLDEPLAALDYKLRKDMQNELKNIQKALGITFVFVTHDQEEALSMSDTVVVMNEGKVQQIGSPIDIYNEPKNAFVADFIGESNILDGTMKADYRAYFSGREFKCLDAGFGVNEPVDIVVRPEDVDIVKKGEGMLDGIVTSVTFRGVHFEIIVDIGGFKWMIQTTDEHKPGEEVGLFIEPDAIHVMKKSKYSGKFGDYSSYSDELDTLNQLPEDEDDE